MIEGCIVAKLVLGYLKGEGLYRTCAAFQDECSLFCDNNKELDNVFLTADLKTILDDYSQLRESGRENGMISGTAILKSLWNDLDIVIGQLKYATIPSSMPKAYVRSQSTRTRQLNYGRSRRSMLPKNQEQRATTTSPTALLLSKPSGNTPTPKLPLPRLPTTESLQNLSASSNRNSPLNIQSTSPSIVVQSSRHSTASKELVNLPRTSSSIQSVGSLVAFSGPHIRGDIQAARTPVSVTPTHSPVTISTNDELARSDNIMVDMFDDIAVGDTCSSIEYDQRRTEDTPPPVIVVDEEMDKDQTVVTVDEHSLPQTHHNHDELHLRSPKRKGIQPKKRVPQGATGTLGAALDSPVKQVPESAEVEMDFMCSSDGLTPQSFLGTLLSTPLLQEKLAENINKVVGCSRQSVNDDTPTDAVQTLTTTEATSDDMFATSNQGGISDIPVKEIIDLMQADPAFDVLFSVFGLDALDALPSAANAPADTSLCTETSVGSSQPVNSSYSMSSASATAAVHIPDSLRVSSLAGKFQSDSGTEINAVLPTASNQQSETSSSSSTSELHLSATSIVTDALLLLAGSPPKIPSQTQSQFVRSTSFHTSEKQNPKTPPKKTRHVQGNSTNSRQPGVKPLSNQASLITSTFPYVRALDFNLRKTPEPVKRGAKRKSKNNKGTRQKATADKPDEASTTKKEAKNTKKSLAVSKSSSSSSSTSSSNNAVIYRNIQPATPSTVSTNIHTCTARPLANCGRPSNPISSSVSVIDPSASSSFSVTNCCTIPTTLPVTVCSAVVSPSPLPANLVTPSIGQVPSGSGPADSLVTLANSGTGSSPAPVIVTAVATRHSPSPASYTNRGSSPVVVNHSSFTSHPTPPTVNFPTSSSIHAPSTVILGNTGSAYAPAPVDATSRLLPCASGVLSSVNPVVCRTPSSANFASSVTNKLSLPTSLVYSNITAKSSASSLPQVFNAATTSSLTEPTQAVIPDHFTDSFTNNGNSVTGQEQNASESSPLATSASSSATDTGTTTVSSVAPFSLQASSMLQTIALQHANADKNEPQEITQLRKESVQGLQKITPRSTSESLTGHQPLREKLASKNNEHLSKDKTGMSNEKHNDEMSDSGSDKKLTNAVPVTGRLTNSQENKNGSTASLTMSHRCSQPMKENSTGILQSGSNSETEGRRSAKQPGKRRRDSLEKDKEKKTKSLSRPSKRSKTKGNNINFPSDLNVEDFLSKLHYEVK